MTLLDIHVLGAPALRQPTIAVREVTDELRALADQMHETMHAARGIGLAAPQVGRPERLFVAEVDQHVVTLFNPEVVTAEGKAKGEEGCLSIPDVYADVERAARVVVRGTGRDGEPIEIEATELFARCLQHEIDHLHGRLFLDYLSPFKRRSALAKWEREKTKYPALRRALTLPAKDLAEQHNDEAL
ncbi:MAG TPA: peptide deformylase [Gemmatirosa sp.]